MKSNYSYKVTIHCPTYFLYVINAILFCYIVFRWHYIWDTFSAFLFFNIVFRWHHLLFRRMGRNVSMASAVTSASASVTGREGFLRRGHRCCNRQSRVWSMTADTGSVQYLREGQSMSANASQAIRVSGIVLYNFSQIFYCHWRTFYVLGYTSFDEEVFCFPIILFS